MMNLDKIKNRAFNKAFSAAEKSCLRHCSTNLLSSTVHRQIECIKTRAPEFVSRFELNSMDYKAIALYEQNMVNAVISEMVRVIQYETLPVYSENLASYEKTLHCYDNLEKQIKDNFATILDAYYKHQFDEWHEAGVVVTGTALNQNKNPIGLTDVSRSIRRGSRAGYEDFDIRVDNPNPIVWLFFQLRDANTHINEDIFFATMAQAVKNYLAKYVCNSDDEIQQLLLCLTQKGNDIIRENMEYLQFEMNDLRQINAGLNNALSSNSNNLRCYQPCYA